MDSRRRVVAGLPAETRVGGGGLAVFRDVAVDAEQVRLAGAFVDTNGAITGGLGLGRIGIGVGEDGLQRFQRRLVTQDARFHRLVELALGFPRQSYSDVVFEAGPVNGFGGNGHLRLRELQIVDVLFPVLPGISLNTVLIKTREHLGSPVREFLQRRLQALDGFSVFGGLDTAESEEALTDIGLAFRPTAVLGYRVPVRGGVAEGLQSAGEIGGIG